MAMAMNRTYKVWAADDVVYGPIDFPTLSQWIREARVTDAIWIYLEDTEQWARAGELPELGLFFEKAAGLMKPGTIAHSPLIPGVPVGALEGVEIFKGMSDQQRGRFAQSMEVQKFAKFEILVNEGDVGNAMFVLLEGVVRVRKMVGGKETLLATLKAGEVFGEISLFDRGKRSADIMANTDGVLLKIDAKEFERLVDQQPEIATPFLAALAVKMSTRMRADNERHKKDLILRQSSS
jgi:hypothetical protein